MKPIPSSKRLGKLTAGPRGAVSGFTLAEIMVSMSVLMLLLAGVISTNLFGMKLYQITLAKLRASANARKALSNMILEIRSAKEVQVGTGDGASFSPAPSGSLQQGLALQIGLTTNANDFVRYYLDHTDQTLRRIASSGAASVVADSLTNDIVFTSEDYAGNVLTNYQNNSVIGITLRFYQAEVPAAGTGSGGLSDFYQVRAKATRRALE